MIRFGDSPQNDYLFEGGQTYDGAGLDLSFSRFTINTSRSRDNPTLFHGQTAIRVEVNDSPLVVDSSTAPYAYGLRVRTSPRINRTQPAIDDLVGVCITNQSYNDHGVAANCTEAIYIGWGGGSTGGASKDWTAGVGIDTVADNGMYIVRGPYAYGILMTATITAAAIRIPNNSPIVGRNAADTGQNDMIRLDTSGNVKLGSGAVRVYAGVANAPADITQPFEIQAQGSTDGNMGKSHERIVDTTAFAANVGGGLGFAGYQDAAPTIRTFAAIAGRKANGTSGNAAGYLSLFSRNAGTGLVEVLRLTELQKAQWADGTDFVFGTTTGHKIGTAASQLLSLWGKAPIVQPTTAVAAAAFVANSGTAVNDASTFGGYTLKQVVQALQNLGALA